MVNALEKRSLIWSTTLVLAAIGCGPIDIEAGRVDAGSAAAGADAAATIVDSDGVTDAGSAVVPDSVLGATAPRLILIALDAMHPNYFTLDALGGPNGGAGNWLMPNVRRFLDGATWYPRAKDHLPSATDMNHLNALAGTSTAQTGVFGVSSQPVSWDETSQQYVAAPISVANARDDQGRPVDTLFKAFKRVHPDAKTAFISGKDWVAAGYQYAGSGVDRIVTATDHPDYVDDPVASGFADPPSDSDAQCDPESSRQSQIERLMMNVPEKAPPDAWTVDAALRYFLRESPQLAYVLLAQTDDLGHALGAADNPAEYVTTGNYTPPAQCVDLPAYDYVSGRDERIYREAILDGIREVDRQFGRLIAGLRLQGALVNATVILLSDHSMATHLRISEVNPRATDYLGLLTGAGLVGATGFLPYSATSFGALFWHDADPAIVASAKALLQQYRTLNRQTGRRESPWLVLDRADMKNGVSDEAGRTLVPPGELYHHWFVDTDGEQTQVWPDLFIFARSGFQLPAYSGALQNLGIEFPIDASLAPFVGGHGALDTQPIVMAFALPNGRRGISTREVRISDIATTAAALFGLTLQSTTIGADLSADLRP